MTDDDSTKRRVRQAIVSHVLAYPDVADTPGGIAQWWLPATGFEGAIDLIDEVLAELVDEGILGKRQLPDGGVVYAAAGTIGFDDSESTDAGE